MLYREEIIERWKYPRYRGVLQNPSAQAEVANMFCGDEISLFLRLDTKKQNIIEARFSGDGCALMAASADILCEAIEGKTMEDAKKFTADDLLRLYGESPTPGRLNCVLLAHRALMRCLASI